MGVSIMPAVPLEDLPDSLISKSTRNIVPTEDLPTSITGRNTTEQVGRGLSSIARGAAIPLAGATLGSTFGPVGAIAGGLALPAAELVASGLNLIPGVDVGSPYALAQKGLTKIGFPTPETTTERALQAGGEAFGSVGGQLPALTKLATTGTSPVTRGVASQLSSLPERQLAASIPSGATAQVVTEKTDSPLLGTLAGVATALPFGIGAKKTGIPTVDDLKAQSSMQYKIAKDSGIVFKKDSFKNFANNLEKTLTTQEGLDADIQPGAFAALKRIISSGNKENSLQDVENLRRIAQGASASTNASERRLGQIMIDELDDFVENAGMSQIKTGDKVGIEALTSARQAWKTAKKAEILDDIFNSAKIREEANFTQSGMENVLRRKLVNLADNKKLMRTFSKVERDAITSAAKGGSIQNTLRALGKFAPTGVISTGGSAGLGYLIGGAPGAIALPVIGGAARTGAEQLGLRNFSKLQDFLLLGGKTPVAPTTGQVLGTRGALTGLEQGLLGNLYNE
jgi:hypothetical protein